MDDKKYLKWYHKIGYGSGDVAGNVVYALLSSFLMFYLTDSIGLSMGVVGTLMAVSKIFDGISDFFFGRLIDRTRTKMGKARPWMLWAYIGCAVTLVATFCVPTSWGITAQYVYFFITYTLLNAVFFTANNIAYASLTALITKNTNERVQLGSFRFIFAFATSMVIQYITLKAVGWCGGGTTGWRTVTIVLALIGLLVNTISCLSVKELREGSEEEENEQAQEKTSFLQSLKLLLSNKYYLMICGTYILTQIYTSMIGMGVYYAKYILGNEDMFGTFSLAINIPLVIGLIVSPILIQKWKGMYAINIGGYLLATLFRGLVVVAGYMGNVPLMLAFTAVAAFGISPLQGDLNALIAACSEYTTRKTGKCIDGMMFSCSSLGLKVGGAIGTAICGWLLDAAGYVENALVQSASCVTMMNVLYLWLPMILCGLITLLLTALKVEKANKKLQNMERK
ncbi:MAG: MFS transporter [Clostridia bacterium]|nr:MFS transporter [Clostridia bacterium]